jgi:hypothetical protein
MALNEMISLPPICWGGRRSNEIIAHAMLMIGRATSKCSIGSFVSRYLCAALFTSDLKETTSQFDDGRLISNKIWRNVNSEILCVVAYCVNRHIFLGVIVERFVRFLIILKSEVRSRK